MLTIRTANIAFLLQQRFGHDIPTSKVTIPIFKNESNEELTATVVGYDDLKHKYITIVVAETMWTENVVAQLSKKVDRKLKHVLENIPDKINLAESNANSYECPYQW